MIIMKGVGLAIIMLSIVGMVYSILVIPDIFPSRTVSWKSTQSHEIVTSLYSMGVIGSGFVCIAAGLMLMRVGDIVGRVKNIEKNIVRI